MYVTGLRVPTEFRMGYWTIMGRIYRCDYTGELYNKALWTKCRFSSRAIYAFNFWATSLAPRFLLMLLFSWLAKSNKILCKNFFFHLNMTRYTFDKALSTFSSFNENFLCINIVCTHICVRYYFRVGIFILLAFYLLRKFSVIYWTIRKDAL